MPLDVGADEAVGRDPSLESSGAGALDGWDVVPPRQRQDAQDAAWSAVWLAAVDLRAEGADGVACVRARASSFSVVCGVLRGPVLGRDPVAGRGAVRRCSRSKEPERGSMRRTWRSSHWTCTCRPMWPGGAV